MNRNDSNDANNKNTLLFNRTIVDIGYFARTSTVGKEFDMVSRYVDHLIQCYERNKRKRAAIFIEPQIETGYPDIVVVEFNSLPPNRWSLMRNSLGTTEFKILFYIQTHNTCAISELTKILGFSQINLEKSILKLSLCGLIHLSSTGKCVRSVSLRSYCRINRVISIEAKIDKWNEAIRQAGNNIWFSTESYVLMNKDFCSEEIQNNCRRQGIGIILVNGKVKTVLESTRRRFPVSYASLEFNELILRYINMRGE